MSGAPFLVQVVPEYQGRGRALIASRPIKPGEVILTDSPILLYPATIATSSTTSHCFHCFRTLLLISDATSFPSCPSCSTHTLFCSDGCHSEALASSHTLWVCKALSHLRSLPPPPLDQQDLLSQAHFLIAAYSLASTSPSNFQRLLSLQGDGNPSEPLSQILHSLLSSLSPPTTPFGFSPELTAALLAKDKMNAFGLMEQFRDGVERTVRAYGIYPNASFFNHDCLPNACRFDYVDRDGSQNTEIIVRAIHEIPKGREVCFSYFPVNWRYAERQRRLLEDYGFQCQCDRCQVEKNWKDDDDEEEEGGDVMEEEEEGCEGDEGMGCVEEEDNDENGDFPHAYFFVKFLCSRENCGGTMAPLPPSPQGLVSNELECNVCGQLRKEEDGILDASEEGDGVMLDDQ